MRKLVLFDVDGTLINAGGAGKRALNRAIIEFGGIKDVCNFFELQGETDRVNFENAFYFSFKRKPTLKEYEKIKSLYLKYLPSEVDYSVKNNLYFEIEGVRKLLEELSKIDNIILGLGTGNIEEGAFIKLKPSGLDNYFKFGSFGEKYRERYKVLKEAQIKAEKILKESINEKNVYVIGDTEKDVLAAKINSYHCGLVLDGFGDKEKVLRSGAEIIEKNFKNTDIWLIWLGIKKDPKGIKRGTYICPDTPIEHSYFGKTGRERYLSQKEMKEIDSIIKKNK
jgi:phosphoglycolate phosphatase